MMRAKGIHVIVRSVEVETGMELQLMLSIFPIPACTTVLIEKRLERKKKEFLKGHKRKIKKKRANCSGSRGELDGIMM